MKSQRLIKLNIKFSVIALLVFVLSNFLNIKSAYSQIDYNYAHYNNSGFRISAGGGVATLVTHFSDNPPLGTFIGSLDYDFDPYITIGIEGQAGQLQGIDKKMHLAYYASTDQYLAGNFNVKVGIGEFYKFASPTALTDILERFYLGAGIGAIHTDITPTYEPAHSAYLYGSFYPKGTYLSIPFNVGTNIDLPGIFSNYIGRDRISLNPNFQFSYVNSMYLDGYQSSPYSHLKGFYNLTSLKIRFKF